jgi:MFS family permease
MDETTPEPDRAPRQHALGMLRYRDFRLLWLGQLSSMTGQQIQSVVIGWHIYVLTDSALQVGLLGLARIIAFLVSSFAGGAIADALDRRRVLLAVQVALAILTALLLATTLSGTINPWLIYAVTLFSTVAGAFDTPARQSLIPSLVPEDELPKGIAMNTLVRQIAFIVGPGAGGLIVGQLGLSAAYAVNVAAFLLAALAMLGMRPAPVAPRPSPGRGLDAVLGGLRYVRSEPLLLSILALDFVVTSLGNVRTLLPIFARDVLQVGPEGLGFLHMAPAVGGLLGALVLGARGTGRRPLITMLAAMGVEGACLLAFGLSAHFGLSLLLLAIMGAANLYGEVPRATLVQVRTPDELRGRVTALMMLFTQGGPSVGQLQSGAVAEVAGPVGAAVFGSCAVIASVAGFSRLPSLRRGVREVVGSGA